MSYSWGIGELDALTRGAGIEKALWLLYGKTGAGKTTLASYVPIVRVTKFFHETLGQLPEEGRFIVMDGDGGFALDRLTEICEANNIDFKDIREKLVHVEFTTFAEQHEFICGPTRGKKVEEEEEISGRELPAQIRETLKEVSKEGLEGWIERKGVKPLLITFDPMTAVYRGIALRTPVDRRAAAMQPYLGKLDLQLATLRRLGVLFNCPVFVTTWPSSALGRAMRERAEKKGERTIEPELPFIGGRSFGFLPKQIWEIRMPDPESTVRVAAVWKSRTSPAGKTGRFALDDAGIVEVG